MANKQNKAPAEGCAGAEIVFSKQKILKMERYAARRDLLQALLEDGKEYTKNQVESLIDDFMKGKVR